MFLELIAAVFAGAAAAGLVLLANRLTGGRLPRWLMPATAGAVILLFTIRMEYSWFDRTTADFPESVVVAERHEARAMWRPWTYLFPLTDRFVAVNTAAFLVKPGVPDQRIVDYVSFGRWQPQQEMPMVIDCASRRGAPLVTGVTYDDSGAVEDAPWAPIPEGDKAFEAICTGEARS